MSRRINDGGMVGVIVSPGWGSGWASRTEDVEYYSMDPTLVDMKLVGATEDQVEEYLLSLDRDIYTGGWDDAVVVWVEPGTAFFIHEYDGSERLVRLSDIQLTA